MRYVNGLRIIDVVKSEFLVEENANPSPLFMIWIDSSILPNMTLEDPHRFVKIHSGTNAERSMQMSYA